MCRKVFQIKLRRRGGAGLGGRDGKGWGGERVGSGGAVGEEWGEGEGCRKSKHDPHRNIIRKHIL
jgi:hypothetical protein